MSNSVLCNVMVSFFLLTSAVGLQAADVKVIYNKGEFPYHVKLLESALEHTKEMGKYEVRASEKTYSISRRIDEIADNTGNVTIMSRSPSTADAELKKLTPIMIPVDKGLSGYRIMVVRKQDLPKFSAIDSFAQFQKLRVGQGSRWVTAGVFSKAGLNMVLGYYAPGLYRMLSEERFDVFPRAVWEAPIELAESQKEVPDLALEPTLALHLPFTTYLWVSQKGDGPALAKRIETGLRRMIADGNFDKLFNEQFGSYLEQTHLHNRKIIEMNNPFLPPDTPLSDKSLWLAIN